MPCNSKVINYWKQNVFHFLSQYVTMPGHGILEDSWRSFNIFLDLQRAFYIFGILSDIECYSEILEDPHKFLAIIRDIQKSLKIFICSCRSSKILEGPGDPQRFSKILRDLRRSSKTFRVLLRSFKIFEDPQRYLEILRDTWKFLNILGDNQSPFKNLCRTLVSR